MSEKLRPRPRLADILGPDLVDPNVSPGRFHRDAARGFLMDVLGMSGKYKVLSNFVERIPVLFSLSGCGIRSITNPHLNTDSGVILLFSGARWGI
jgi:hypothetical protein